MKTAGSFVLFLVFSLLFAGCPQFGNGPQPPEEVVIVEPESAAPVAGGDGKTVITIKNETGSGVVTNNSDLPPAPPYPSSLKITPGYTQNREGRFAIYFIYVGTDVLQGDAILVKRGDFDMLIDAGNAQTGSRVINFLRSKGVDDLEVLVSTHADAEHYGGISDVLDEFGVEEFWWPGKLYEDNAYGKLINRIHTENIPIKEVKRSENYNFNGLDVAVLNPSATKNFGDRDNDAIALKITNGNFCIILTSDLFAGAQGALANDPAVSLRCDLLQIPGHGLGSATNMIGIFLLKVSPKFAIFSGSLNDPSADLRGTRYTIYEKLRLRGIPYYENYVNGTIRVESDGLTYAIDYLPN